VKDKTWITSKRSGKSKFRQNKAIAAAAGERIPRSNPTGPAQICATFPTLACSLDAKRTRLCGAFRPNRDGTRLAAVVCGMDWKSFIDAGKQFCR
jgi:hypothetical protein